MIPGTIERDRVKILLRQIDARSPQYVWQTAICLATCGYAATGTRLFAIDRTVGIARCYPTALAELIEGAKGGGDE